MRTNGPWKIIDSVEKYKNRWMRVREDKVIQPDGKDGIVGIAEIMDGVSVLPLDDEGYVYLVEQFRYTLERKTVETVSGGVEKDEDPLSAAQRELREEAGITAQKWTKLGEINPLVGPIKTVSNLFLARQLRFSKPDPDGSELIEVTKIRFDEAVRMVREGKITHGPSCVLILLASEHLQEDERAVVC